MIDEACVQPKRLKNLPKQKSVFGFLKLNQFLKFKSLKSFNNQNEKSIKAASEILTLLKLIDEMLVSVINNKFIKMIYF